MNPSRRIVLKATAALIYLHSAALAFDVCDIGSRRELFVDDYLVGELRGTALKMHSPQLMSLPGSCPQGHYATILLEDGRYRMYSRQYLVPGIHWKKDGWDNYHRSEVYALLESRDGIYWTKPRLGVYDLPQFPDGNVVFAGSQGNHLATHNFTPFVDTRPGAASEERYKALGGLHYQEHYRKFIPEMGPGGLFAFASGDGVHWKKLQEGPVIPDDWGTFDSQNGAFWSTSEKTYVCYFRTFVKGYRSISRTTSQDFIHWSPPQPMEVNLPDEHLYTSGTSPYFRAPHIYIALPTRFQAKRGATTDIMLMSTRGGAKFDRTFKEAFIRPGVGKGGWGDRSNYAALNVVPTSDSELSIYLAGNRRYVLRYDGFASVNAPYEEGEMLTKPLVFSGKELEINHSTSAAGRVRVEIQDAAGQPIPGYTLDDCPQIVGDEIEHVVAWTAGSDLSKLKGRPVRLRFVMQDADLFSLRFR